MITRRCGPLPRFVETDNGPVALLLVLAGDRPGTPVCIAAALLVNVNDRHILTQAEGERHVAKRQRRDRLHVVEMRPIPVAEPRRLIGDVVVERAFITGIKHDAGGLALVAADIELLGDGPELARLLPRFRCRGDIGDCVFHVGLHGIEPCNEHTDNVCRGPRASGGCAAICRALSFTFGHLFAFQFELEIINMPSPDPDGAEKET